MHPYFGTFFALLLACGLTACGGPQCPDGLARCPLPADAGIRAPDAGTVDAGEPPPPDGGPADANDPSTPDSGVPDAGDADGGGSSEPDAGPEDAGDEPDDAGPFYPGVDIDRALRGQALFTHDYTGDSRLGVENGLSLPDTLQHFPVPDGGEVGRDYNGVSCVHCHGTPVPGGQGDPANSGHLDAYRFNTVTGEYPYASITTQGFSLPPDLRGRGELDAVSDETIQNGCGIDPNRGIHGTPLYNGDDSNLTVTRFGREGLTAHLYQFVAVAYEGELGLTNVDSRIRVTPEEAEVSQTDVADTAYYVSQLKPPRSLPLTAETTHGKELFTSVGCAVCHDPNRQGTDQCMHDMGTAMLDDFDPVYHRPSGSYWLTGRLVGVREMRFFLHDGRATDLPGALQMHGGEAVAVMNAFHALTLDDQAALLAYVNAR